MRNLFAERFLASASHKELLSIEHDTYDFADVISAIIPVVSFNELTVSLPVISPDTLYWRTNHSFLRGRNPEELIQPYVSDHTTLAHRSNSPSELPTHL